MISCKRLKAVKTKIQTEERTLQSELKTGQETRPERHLHLLAAGF